MKTSTKPQKNFSNPSSAEWQQFAVIAKKHALRLALKNNLKNTRGT